MKVLLTGATGYLGRRLLPALVNAGHRVICLVRNRNRFDWDDFSEEFLENVEVVEADLEKPETLKELPNDFNAAYYLVHSLSSSYEGFEKTEKATATNFAEFVSTSNAKQIIYLGGIANEEGLSEHLQSRKNVERILKSSGIPTTVLRAAIVIGSGSASFEIIRDLVEKLPVMIAPKWLNSRCQPISIRNVIDYLLGVLDNEATLNGTFDIGGPDILTYKEMLLGYAKSRKLNRYIFSVPVLTPRLSSLWLYFVTSTSYALARNLVDSMKNNVTVQLGNIDELVDVKRINYQESLSMAFSKISQKNIVSSWTDAIGNTRINSNFMDLIEVPSHGCLKDCQEIEISRNDINAIRNNIWTIGGNKGWYYGNWMWKVRGMMDKFVGGVGLRRGRRSESELKAGDSLDFWRVLLADHENTRLLLYAEMKLPGEAWLEFKIESKDNRNTLVQTATFRPLGLGGRLYWYTLIPFHAFIFPQMARAITKKL